MQHLRQFARACVLFCFPVFVLAMHAWYYFPFVADDALISLRYAHRLLEGKGLTWTDGIRVEGYSNFLWTILCAAMGALGVDLIDAARILGFAFSIAVIAVLWFRYQRNIGKNTPAFLISALVIACSGSMAVWAIGGLEQPLLAALLAWALVLSLKILETPSPTIRTGVCVGILLGLIAITRPDGMLFTVAIALAIALALRGNRMRIRMVLAIIIPAGMCYVGLLCFRLAYYGEWVPNTALVKLVVSPNYFFNGTKQLCYALAYLIPLIALTAVLIRTKKNQTTSAQNTTLISKLLLLGGSSLMWLGYSVLTGGDIFPARRFLVPVVVMIAFALGELVLSSTAFVRTKRGVIFSAAMLVLFFIGQFADRHNNRALTERWEWKGRTIARMLVSRYASTSPLIGVESAGSIPYWTDFPCVDLLGLNDYYLPRHRPAMFGSGIPAHELGDPDYVLACNPDIIMFGIPEGSLIGTRSEILLLHDQRFFDRYARVIFKMENDAILTSLWVRKDSRAVNLAALKHEADSTHRITVIEENAEH